ncbi:hypothetical protein PIB30_055892 [Stylosanthes scabra]|uniref:PB1-like domain-containing protein n=1 Tax=Stylosanthes scabra TaxID=79078 RepID=A0ABU6ZHV0_9FABA|nr:hypothetical protein [Stylosanthes scabra]
METLLGEGKLLRPTSFYFHCGGTIASDRLLLSMMSKKVIPVIHVGGQIGANDNGVLSYMDGEVQTFDALDPEMLCISDLEGMTKSLGFSLYTAMILMTNCVDFEVFFKHPIFEPIVAEDFEVDGEGGCINLDRDEEAKSSSHDSYESAEYEAYKSPPEGYELSSDSDSGRRKNVKKKKTRTKKVMIPTKKSSPKKKGCKTPTKKETPNMDTNGLVNDDVEGVVSGSGSQPKSDAGLGSGEPIIEEV